MLQNQVSILEQAIRIKKMWVAVSFYIDITCRHPSGKHLLANQSGNRIRVGS